MAKKKDLSKVYKEQKDELIRRIGLNEFNKRNEPESIRRNGLSDITRQGPKGVWRTVRGRHVFIEEGKTLEQALGHKPGVENQRKMERSSKETLDLALMDLSNPDAKGWIRDVASKTTNAKLKDKLKTALIDLSSQDAKDLIKSVRRSIR